MRRFLQLCTAVVLCCVVSLSAAYAQCPANTAIWQSGQVPNFAGVDDVATTCAYAGDYTPISVDAASAGTSATVIVAGGTAPYITIYDDTNTTPIVWGPDSVVVPITAGVGFTVHVTEVDSTGNCATDSNCHTITSKCNDCPPQPAGCTDTAAHNYDPNAGSDDGSCMTCTDGMMNGDETGVDCGGTNPNCPTCPVLITSCMATFADSGDTTANYASSENMIYTFCPDAGGNISANFTAFDTENDFDFLYAFDGADINAPALGTYTGTTSPGTVVASNGCLTFQFISDGSVTAAGWFADISCVACVPPTVTAMAICDTIGLDNTGYYVDLTIAGGASSYTISDDAGIIGSVPAGTYTVGPYANNVPVNITVTDDTDAACVVTVSAVSDCACVAGPPANDVCTGATPLMEGTNGPFSNNCTTSDADDSFATCFSGLTNTVWYSIMGDGNEITVFATGLNASGVNDLADYETDLEFSIFEGACGALVEMGCYQDVVGDPGDSAFQPSATFTTTPGMMYYVLVDGWGTGDPIGDFYLQLDVAAPPCTLTAAVTATDATCAGNDGTAMATATGGTAPYTYDWTSAGGASASGTDMLSALPIDDYTVIITDANGCTATATASVADGCVVPCPEPTNLTHTIEPNGCNTLRFSWDPVAEATAYEIGGRRAGGTLRFWTVTDPFRDFTGLVDGRTYQWSVRAICGADVSTYQPITSQQFVYTSSAGCVGAKTTLPDPFDSQALDINIYPNPASNFVTVTLGGLELNQATNLEVVDAMGRVVYSQTTDDSQVEINVADLSNGYYFVRATSGDMNTIQKMVVTK